MLQGQRLRPASYIYLSMSPPMTCPSPVTTLPSTLVLCCPCHLHSQGSYLPGLSLGPSTEHVEGVLLGQGCPRAATACILGNSDSNAGGWPVLILSTPTAAGSEHSMAACKAGATAMPQQVRRLRPREGKPLVAPRPAGLPQAHSPATLQVLPPQAAPPGLGVGGVLRTFRVLPCYVRT